MGRFYTVEFRTLVSAQQDLFEVTCPADAVVRLARVELEQTPLASEANETRLSILIKNGSPATTPGSGGTVLVPKPVVPGGAPMASRVVGNNTTKMSG